MLSNYSTNKDGLIYQINKKPFIYNEEYVKNRYDSYGEKTCYMSHLRLGYVLGSINKKINSIMDIGYGNGNFLITCKKSMPNCYGSDISGYELPSDISFVENWADHPVDVVTFFDALEHMENPYVLEKIKSKYIIVSLPWCHYFSDEWFENWKHRRPDEHLWFFNEKNIYNFAKSIGFKIINYCCAEDAIRGKNADGSDNILTFCMEKI